NLRFEDVRPADGLAFDGDFAGRVVLDNGLVFTFESADEDGRQWLRFSAAAVAAASPQAVAGDDAGAAGDSVVGESVDPEQEATSARASAPAASRETSGARGATAHRTPPAPSHRQKPPRHWLPWPSERGRSPAGPARPAAPLVSSGPLLSLTWCRGRPQRYR